MAQVRQRRNHFSTLCSSGRNPFPAAAMVQRFRRTFIAVAGAIFWAVVFAVVVVVVGRRRRRTVFAWTTLLLPGWHDILKIPIQNYVLSLSPGVVETGNFCEAAAAATKDCACVDPRIPKGRVQDSAWMKHHQSLSEEARRQSTNDVDVVFLGDSLTERWRGTRQFGTRNLSDRAEHQAAFANMFDVNRTGLNVVSSLALGTASSTSPELLWQLQNGWLPPSLNPKLFFLLIGTNDMGVTACSKIASLIGILTIVDYIHQSRPNTPILIHGLLPRLDPKPTKQLGHYWDNIQWINQELRTLVQDQQHHSSQNYLYYMESKHLFLEQQESVIRQHLMPDGLHPNLQGYQVWAQHIAETVVKILH